MASKRRTKTPTIAQLYKEERRKAERRIKNIEKRGYYFAETPLKEPPKKPTRKSIEALQKLTPSKLYQIAEYRTPSGQILSGTEGRTYERKVAAQKGARTRTYNRTGRYYPTSEEKNYRSEQIFERNYDIYDTGDYYRGKDYIDVANELSDSYNIPLAEAYDYAYEMPKYVDVHEWYSENSKQAKIKQLEEQAGKDVDKVLEKRDEAYKDIAKQNLTSWESRSLIDDITNHASNEIDEIYNKLDEDIQKINEAQVKDIVRNNVDIKPPSKVGQTTYTDESEWDEESSNTAMGKTPDYTYADERYYPNEGDIVLQNIENYLTNWTPDPKQSKTGRAMVEDSMSHVKSILNRALSTQGRDAVAQRLEENADEINSLIEVLSSSSDSAVIQADLGRLADILNGSILDLNEKLELGELQDEYDGDEYEI